MASTLSIVGCVFSHSLTFSLVSSSDRANNRRATSTKPLKLSPGTDSLKYLVAQKDEEKKEAEKEMANKKKWDTRRSLRRQKGRRNYGRDFFARAIESRAECQRMSGELDGAGDDTFNFWNGRAKLVPVQYDLPCATLPVGLGAHDRSEGPDHS
jgi:hypothetical protein